jgi:acetolactate synthase-1/2/3 large subunit
MSSISGAEAMVRSLTQEGVEVIFGIPGVQVMAALDAIYQHKGIRWLTVRHEQTAAFMAYGYARTTGKAGVAFVVPGPGALNATAALGTAYAASTPIFLISGQIESYNLNQNHGALHEVDDQLDVFRPLTKWCHRVLKVEDIPKTVQEAIQQSRRGRPRPVELEIPWDLWETSATVEFSKAESISSKKPEPERIREAASLLADATRPLIWAGGGVISADASEELTRLAEHLNAPTITTGEGKGAIIENHPLALGDPNFGTNPALAQADVILVIGSRFYLRRSQWTPQPEQKIVQIDIDPAEVARNYPVEMGIVADAGSAIVSLLEELPEATKSQWQMAELKEIKMKIMTKLEEVAPLQLSLIRVIRDELKDGILIPGVTNMGYWCNLAYPVLQPRSYLTSSYFATLGYAFPTALGAKIGNPERPVVALCGDGGFLYAAPELATAVQEGINVVTLVFVDEALGACLRIQQRSFEDRIIGTRLHNPDFALLAESFGARGIKLSHPEKLAEELRDALRSALAENRPTVIEVPVPNMVQPWEVSLNP